MESNRPFVVCHILSTLDGKISGSFFGAEEVIAPQRTYGEVRNFYQCDATLYGTSTMEESYGTVKRLPFSDFEYPREDYIAQSDVHNFIVSIDTEGILQFSSKYLVRGGRDKAHVIEVLSENVSDDYIAYLRSMDISYIFAGKEALDITLALHKLKEKFGIELLMLAGGGKINQTLLQADLIDELSLVLVPLVEGSTKEVSVFERSVFLDDHPPVAFKLIEAKPTDGDGLWLRYKTKRQEANK